MHRCVPGIVQSRRPEVPSAQPSHTPSRRMRQANGSCVAVLPRDARHLAVVVRLLLTDAEDGHGPYCDPSACVRVDVEAVAADEADERHAGARSPDRWPGSTARTPTRRTGMPASSAFCTISNDVRPLTNEHGTGRAEARRAAAGGRRPCRRRCGDRRPRRRRSSTPVDVNSPAAWRPPVSIEDRLVRAQQRSAVVRRRRHRATGLVRAPRRAAPRRPHQSRQSTVDRTPRTPSRRRRPRVARRGVPDRRSADGSTSVAVDDVLARRRTPDRCSARSSRDRPGTRARPRPTETQPPARDRAPGVRMITANGRPCSRISERLFPRSPRGRCRQRVGRSDTRIHVSRIETAPAHLQPRSSGHHSGFTVTISRHGRHLLVRHHLAHRLPGSRQRAQPGAQGSRPALRLQGREGGDRAEPDRQDADAPRRRRDEDERAVGDRADAAGAAGRADQELQGGRERSRRPAARSAASSRFSRASPSRRRARS